MTTLADVLRMHGPEYLKRYQNNLLPSHRKVMRDILLCRSDYLGWHEWFCPQCQKIHYLNNSCRNRHCPQCQKDKTQNWINRQQEMLLPAEYFLFTFTIPQQLRPLARANQKLFFNILFKVSSQCLQILAKDKRFLNGQTGMVGILHSWTQTLDYHPHIHYIIPGIALDSQKQILRYAKDGFLVHIKPLSRLFCYKLKKALIQTSLKDKIPTYSFNGKWVVHGKSVGSGIHAIKYLAQYVYRIAISDQRIIACNNGMVTFKYKDRDSKIEKFMTIPALEFMRRFLQHILPKGFQKIRYYGFLHPKRKLLFNRMRLLLKAKLQSHAGQENKSLITNTRMLCPDCDRPMICIGRKLITRPPPLNELFRKTAA
jgi:hypothetical protein